LALEAVFSKMAAPAQTITFAITGPITRDDLPGLCNRVCALLEQGSASVAFCDVTGVGVDAVTVDALARFQLGARRRKCTVRLLNASAELMALVHFMGLENVIA
jgi:ABC-type transporter Mla MlaB component